MSGFLLPANYGIPMLSAVLLGFECIMIGFLFPGRVRGKVFTKDFLKANFAEIHHDSTEKEDVTTQFGYPDMGSGKFSEKLPYGDWLRFNRAQRVHYNFIEQLAPVLIFILVAGVKFPEASGALGFGFFLARIFYCFYVSKNGPTHPLRGLGAILGDFIMIALLILSIISCGYHMG